MAQGLNKVEVDDFDLTSWTKDKLSTLSPDSVTYGKKCIYKAPRKNAGKNDAEYVPRVVSIGFLHHGKSQLEDMQVHKVKYLHHFLRTFQVSIEQLVEYIRGQENLVCECYEDTIVHDLSERCKVKPSSVVLLDGIFIIDLLLKNHFPGTREEGDIVFNNSRVSNYVLHDLMLFENQLPLRFLRALYNEFVSSGAINSAPAFDQLVAQYFKNVGRTESLLLVPELLNARHFVEFLSILHNPDKNIPRIGLKVVKKLDLDVCPSAVELEASGVKFLHGSNVWFDVDKGELTIPQLNLNTSTSTFLRNVIAFEQSGCHSKHTTTYAMLLSNLIDSKRDLQLLINNGIIKNELNGSTWEVLGIFSSVYEELDPEDDHFVGLDYKQLRAYRRDIFHGWQSGLSNIMNILRRDYFNAPWTMINVLYILIGLYIGIVQTVFAVLQYVRK